MIFDRLLNAILGENGHLTMDKALRKILDANESMTAQELLAEISAKLETLCEADFEYREWNRWLGALWNAFGNRQFRVAQIAAKLNRGDGVLLQRALPVDLKETHHRRPSFNCSLGRALVRHEGHVTASGLVQQQVSRHESKKRGWSWRIMDLGSQEVLDWFHGELRDQTEWWESSAL